MKKIIGILFISIIVLSCSKDEPVPVMTVQNKDIALYHDKTEAIVVKNAKDIVIYTPENKLIATVSEDGVVTGGVRGKTSIIVSSAGETASVNVSVSTLINFIPEPYLKFGQSFEAVKGELEKNGSVIVSNGNLVQLHTIDGKECSYVYLFENGNMKSCGFLIEVLSKTMGSIVDFLMERYVVVAKTGTYSYMFITPDKKTEIYLSPSDDMEYIVILYLPASETKSANQPDTNNIDNIVKYAVK